MADSDAVELVAELIDQMRKNWGSTYAEKALWKSTIDASEARSLAATKYQ
jgi:hypothetical protein